MVGFLGKGTRSLCHLLLEELPSRCLALNSMMLVTRSQESNIGSMSWPVSGADPGRSTPYGEPCKAWSTSTFRLRIGWMNKH
jgi:hypothetical protein